MKSIFILILVASLWSCNQRPDGGRILQDRVDSLEMRLNETYIPGFGEFMSNIQVHHAKLWFAGQNKNWKLAAFELDEIRESLADLQKYQKDRMEAKMLPMINPALDQMKNAIQSENPEIFNRNFTELTNTCNECHEATHFEFNRMKVPEAPPFTNQEFKPVK